MKKIYKFIRPLVMFLAAYIAVKGMFVYYGVPFFESASLLTISYILGLLRGVKAAVEVVRNEPGKR